MRLYFISIPMNLTSYSIYIGAIILTIGTLCSCNHERQVVPYEEDEAEVFKALPPNEECSPENLTFGKADIPGFIFDYEIPTDSEEIYVFFENLTVLDVNPKINQNIFDFIQDNLKEFGFVNNSLNLDKTGFPELVASGLSYLEASVKLLENIKSGFEAQLPSIQAYQSPFNIYFQIYPVYLNSDLVTYRESAYCYTGGAHGISISNLITYDLSTGEVLKLNDIVKPDGLQFVREEVAAHMAYSYPIYENIATVQQYIDSLNVWLNNGNSEEGESPITLQDYPLTNPGVTEEGLVFIYPMYELTPGSDGCPVVVIPYKDIKGCLFEKFKQ